jgi:hypothetical protein
MTGMVKPIGDPVLLYIMFSERVAGAGFGTVTATTVTSSRLIAT